MVARKLKKYIPTREYVENHKWLGFIKHKLDGKPYLWDFERWHVVKATWIGVFWAMLPMPFQMLPAAFFAVLFRANILVAIAWVWVSNPFTMLPILYCSYFLGCHALGVEFSANMISANFHHIFANWHLLLLPLIVGSIIFGVFCSILIASIVWLVYGLKGKQA